MNIKFDNHSIVLQDTNNCIFLVDTNDKTKRTIFTAPKESLFIPLICEDRYCFIVQTEKPGWIADTSSIKVITLLDIYELLLQLNFDQIELLAYIYYSAKYNHKVNLTGDSIENRHALEAFNSLPEKIKQCIQEFVILPQLSDSCVIS